MRGKAFCVHHRLAIFSCLYILVISSFVAAQSSGNEDTYMYITCGNPVFIAPGPDTVCFDLMYHIEGTGSEKITGFSVPLKISSTPLNSIASVDTTEASTFPATSGVYGFNIKVISPQTSPPDYYHTILGAVTLGSGITGDGLFAKVCVVVNSACVVNIDTLSIVSEGNYKMAQENSIEFVPGWGGRPVGYSGGINCFLTNCYPPNYATGTGYGVLGDFKGHIDTYDNGPLYELKDIARQTDTDPHGHDGEMLCDASISTFIWIDSLNTPIMTDPDNYWNALSQRPGVDAHVYAGWTYDYMLDSLGWNGFDNLGSYMYSIVDRQPAKNLAEFHYSSEYVYYYRPTSSSYYSSAGCLDAVAHEWGHGLTKYASGLLYERESGALSESFSDMLGVSVGFANNDADWLVNENMYPSNPLLFGVDMENPLNSFQPDTVGALFWVNPNCSDPDSLNDYCGVHTNSGVPNKMFHLLSVGGTHYDVTVTGIGIHKAMRIMYRANRVYWDSLTNFIKGARGAVMAAFDLDSTGTWARRTGKAWEAVRVCKAMPGDANASGTYTLADVISIVNYVFNRPGCSPQPICWLSGLKCRGDCNGDGGVSVADIVILVNYYFNKPCSNPNHPPTGCWLPRPSDICCTYYP